MTNKLQERRKALGLSRERLAEMADLSASHLTKLERGERKLTREWAQKLAPHLDTTWAELMGWDGVSVGPPNLKAPGTSRPTELPERSVLLPEYDVRPQAGFGGDMPELEGGGEHPVVATWAIPPTYLRAFTEEPEAVRIIRVAGDSMEPDYPAGDRVAVDTSHRVPSPPGVYVLWDGFGLVLKRVEIVMGSDPPMLRLMSINPAYPVYERPLDSVVINGRVIGKWVWR